jgi:phosphoribosylamine-glycine ligase
MKPFTPSPAFRAYYDAVMAAVNGPMTPGMGSALLPTPTLTDSSEQAFVNTQLVPLLNALNAYRAALTPPPPVYDPTIPTSYSAP